MNRFSRRNDKVRCLPVAGALASALTLGGCADLRRSVSLPPVNPESPVAGIVAPAARLDYDVPRLSDVPPLPKNVPDAGSVKLGVVSMVRCRGGLERFPITHPPLSGGTVEFAAAERDVAQVNPADVPPPDSAARSDAFAASLRAEVAPPPAIASGSALNADQSRPPAPPAPHPAVPARPPRHAAASKAAPPPPQPAVQTAAAPAVPARVVETDVTPPPLPAPLPDPLLARCT